MIIDNKRYSGIKSGIVSTDVLRNHFKVMAVDTLYDNDFDDFIDVVLNHRTNWMTYQVLLAEVHAILEELEDHKYHSDQVDSVTGNYPGCEIDYAVETIYGELHNYVDIDRQFILEQVEPMALSLLDGNRPDVDREMLNNIVLGRTGIEDYFSDRTEDTLFYSAYEWYRSNHGVNIISPLRNYVHKKVNAFSKLP